MAASPNLITTLAGLLPRTNIRLRRCPQNLQLYALRQAWRTWCAKGEAWLQTLTLDVVASQQIYSLVYGTTGGADTSVLVVSGAGTAGFNQSYTLVGGQWVGQTDADYAIVNLYPWKLLKRGVVDAFYDSSSGTALGPYTVAGGTAPAPTVAYGTLTGSEVEMRRVWDVWLRNDADVSANRRGLPVPHERYTVLLPSGAMAGAPGDNGTPRIVFADCASTVAVTAGMLVDVALVPKQNSTVEPPATVLLYASDALCAGALAELAAMQDKAWTSPRLAAEQAELFGNLVAQARADVLRGGGKNTQTYKPDSFF